MDFLQNMKPFISEPFIEWLAAITGIASVWFAKKENVLVYPIGIISVALYTLICYFAKLYADAFINLYYLIISVFGWYYWLAGGRFQKGEQNKDSAHAQIIQSGRNETLFYFASSLFLYFFIGYLLSRHTDSNVPWVDALNTSMFVIAMYLMAKKNILHWWFWIIGNIISIPLYIYKELYITAIQYLIFLAIAIAGYIVWRKKLHAENNSYRA